jgi:hypothetical protein
LSIISVPGGTVSALVELAPIVPVGEEIARRVAYDDPGTGKDATSLITRRPAPDE